MAGNVANIKVYNPLKRCSGLTGNYHAICHYSYNLPICSIQNMTILNRNIGKEFEKQMKEWFIIHPEITHQWNESELIISHPTDSNKRSVFKYNASSLVVNTGTKTLMVKRKLFSNVFEQIFRLRGRWISAFLEEDDKNNKFPKLKENEYAVLVCNSKYGQVLTHDKNLFTGWGEIYKIFDDIKSAEDYCKNQDYEKFEFYIYNSDNCMVKLFR